MKQQAQESKLWMDWMLRMLKGGAVAVVVAGVSLLLCAALISGGLVPATWEQQVVLGTCLISTIIGSIVAVYGLREQVLLVSLGVGLCTVFFFLCLGAVLFGGALLDTGCIQNVLACCGGSAIIGILGRKPKKKRKR